MNKHPGARTPMRFLIRVAPASGDGVSFLAAVRSIASSLGVQVRNPKWTTYGALEVDLFAESRSDFELCLAALGPLCKVDFAKDLGEAPPYRSPEEVVREARALFNAERYWESHEVLEGLWRTLSGEDKKYLQGVILVCAAFVHHQKGEDLVALGILGRAEGQLSVSRSGCSGIESSVLLQGVRRVLLSGSFKPFKI